MRKKVAMKVALDEFQINHNQPSNIRNIDNNHSKINYEEENSYMDNDFDNVSSNESITSKENQINEEDSQYDGRSHGTQEIQNNNQTSSVLENYEPNKYTRIICGDFHHGSERFVELSRGNQCVAISVFALCFLKINDNPASWKKADINSIIINGDAQYHASYNQLKREGRTFHTEPLSITEVYPYIRIGRKYFCLNNDGSAIDDSRVEEVLTWNNLLTSLNRLFNGNENQSGVFICNTYSFAIMPKRESFFLFNSHPSSYAGEPTDANVEESAACLMEIDSITGLAYHLLVACDQKQVIFDDCEYDQHIFFSITNLNIAKKVFGRDILKRRKVNRDLCITEDKRVNVTRKPMQTEGCISKHQSEGLGQKRKHLGIQTNEILENRISEMMKKQKRSHKETSRSALSLIQNEHHTGPSACSFEFDEGINIIDSENQITKEVLIGCGMLNIGNSCFFNACFQAFFHIPAVNIHLQNTTRKQCTCEVCNIITTFKETHTYPTRTPYDPSKLYNALRQGNEALLNGKQQDANEFWIRILSVMEKKGNNSAKLFDRLFLHDVITNVRCENCHTISRTCREFRGHMIQCLGHITIQEAINAYFAEEVLETYKCDACAYINSRAKKNYSLKSAPNILVLTLNRFEANREKHQDDIIMNEQVKLSEYNYNLVSLINHIGTNPFEGHYTATVRSNNSFYEFDDTSVHTVHGISGINAYILIYEISSSMMKMNNNFVSETVHTNISQPDNANLSEEISIENESISANGHSGDEFQSRDDVNLQNQEEFDEYDFDDVNIQCSDNIQIKGPTGRRIVDIGLIFEQIRNLNRHYEGCESEMIFIKETKLGFRSIFHFQCSNCGHSYQIQSSTKNDDTMNVNKAATLGITSIGSGFYHMEEVFAHFEIPCMSSSNFDIENKKMQKEWNLLAKLKAEEALKEEIRLAIARGDVDSAGNALIIVVCDGSWAKRSYGKGYSSLSGCAAIIGYHTKKVLYFDTKNKYCNICTKSYAKNCPPNDHPCNINYTGPSSGMETEILVEGFQSCKLLGARFHKIISDGDSSAFKEITERCVYQNPDVAIEKLECVNHLFKNFHKKFSALCSSTKQKLNCRKIMNPSIGHEISKGVRMAAKHWRESNLSMMEKLENLERDCLNAPNHYFGNHDNCDKYFCTKVTTADSNAKITLLKSGGMFYEIMNACNIYFASNVRSLIEDCTNNSAEEFNSVVAKYLGGKRINYSLAGSYSGRVAASVVQYNSKGHAGSEFHKFSNINENKFLLKMENSRKKHYEKNEAARKSKPRKKPKIDKTTKDYGDCQKPDMSDHIFEIAKNLELAKIETNRINRNTILVETFGQKFTENWSRMLEIRKQIINCSYFGRIINSRSPASYTKLLEEMMYSPSDFGNAAEIRHQRLCEQEALNMFCLVHKDHQLKKTGIFIDPEFGFLGASPLRLYGTDSIVSVHCPVKAYQKTVDEAMSKKFLPYFKIKNGKICIDIKSNWYLEVQGQLHITDRQIAYLVVWLGPEFIIEKVAVNQSLWDIQMKTKLQFFFNQAMIKELANPRRARKMKLRKYDSATETFI